MGEFLSSGRIVILFDGHALLPLEKLLAHPQQVIDLTIDDDKNGEEDDAGVAIQASWLRNTRTTQYRVRLIPPSLTDCFQIADNLPSPPPTKATHTPLTPTRPLQRPHTAEKITLRRMYLPGRHCTAGSNSIPPRLFTT